MHNLVLIIPLLILLSGFFLFGSRLKNFYSFRHIIPQDNIQLHQLITLLGEPADGPGLNLNTDYESLLLKIENNTFTARYLCHVCEVKHDIVGVIVMESDEGDLINASCHLCFLAVRPDHRLKGIAGTLLSRSINTARESGCKSITIKVCKPSQALNKLLQNFNFAHFQQERLIKTYPQHYILNLSEHSEEKYTP
ncbi:MAG: Acetyltransferase family [Bacteroidetes bacterium]|nr:Acetyltransferase family [Bacteroidota bacterium]